MKKALYLILGVIVAIFGLLLLRIWWLSFVDFLKGVLGPVVILIGVIIFIIGWMTPAKEETFEEPSVESEVKPEEEEKKE
jgi:H+/Cl- antiporter ClcA